MDSNSFDFPSASETSYHADDSERLRSPRGSAWLAWLAIFLTICVILIIPHFIHRDGAGDPSTILFEIQARYLVGVSSLSIQGDTTVESQIELVFNKGSLRQRMIGAVLLGELVSPQRAQSLLEQLKTKVDDGKLSAKRDDQKALELLKQVQSARIDGTPLDAIMPAGDGDADRALLVKQLGWAGRLALLPPGSPDQESRARLLDHARQTFFVMLAVFGLAVMGTAMGAVLQLVWWIFAAMGRLSSGIPPIQGDGAIYAETFAVWLALFMALNVAVISLPLPKWGLVWVLIPQIGSLGALAWPVFRGISWRDVRTDLGLSFGPQAWTAPFAGVGAYLCALPVLAVAMIVTIAMMAIASQFAEPGDTTATPVHPIVEPILRGNWTVRLQLFFVAIFAAVPEEIMFRGVLYRHLREAGSRLGYIGRVAVAALISSFIFAVIHPQGLFGIPILMGLAVVLALVREWRGSIVPSMIAHAMVNAGTSTVLLLIAD